LHVDYVFMVIDLHIVEILWIWGYEDIKQSPFNVSEKAELWVVVID